MLPLQLYLYTPLSGLCVGLSTPEAGRAYKPAADHGAPNVQLVGRELLLVQRGNLVFIVFSYPFRLFSSLETTHVTNVNAGQPPVRHS